MNIPSFDSLALPARPHYSDSTSALATSQISLRGDLRARCANSENTRRVSLTSPTQPNHVAQMVTLCLSKAWPLYRPPLAACIPGGPQMEPQYKKPAPTQSVSAKGKTAVCG